MHHKYINQINGERIHTCGDVVCALDGLRKNGASEFTLTLATDVSDLPPISQHGVPQIYFNQLNGIHGHLSDILPHNDNRNMTPSACVLNSNLQLYDQPVNTPTLAPSLQPDQIRHLHDILQETSASISSHGLVHNRATPFPSETPHTSAPWVQKASQDTKKLCCKDLIHAGDWKEWEQAEWLQLNQYHQQHLFGEPCPPPANRGISNLVWSHYYKTDGSNNRKARCTCDGSPRSGQAHTLDHTYASCVDQNATRLFYANAALQNHVIAGADASNAFGEAP